MSGLVDALCFDHGGRSTDDDCPMCKQWHAGWNAGISTGRLFELIALLESDVKKSGDLYQWVRERLKEAPDG